MRVTTRQQIFGVVDPGPRSIQCDVLFETTLIGIGNMVKGGLDPAHENLEIFTDEFEALEEAQRRLAARGK